MSASASVLTNKYEMTVNENLNAQIVQCMKDLELMLDKWQEKIYDDSVNN